MGVSDPDMDLDFDEGPINIDNEPLEQENENSRPKMTLVKGTSDRIPLVDPYVNPYTSPGFPIIDK